MTEYLDAIDPELQEGEFVFCTFPPGGAPPDLDAVMFMEEPEGRTCVIRREVAEANGLPYEFPAAWITLTVQSDLAAVGLLASVTARLAGAGIATNVVSAFFHDHLFVPVSRAAEAIELLRQLQDEARRTRVPPAMRRGRLRETSDSPQTGEAFDPVLDAPGARIEHILSSDEPEPGLYRQDHDEWVVVLAGAAALDVAGDRVELAEGDWLLLPRGAPHQVLSTAAGTSWLAVHLLRT